MRTLRFKTQLLSFASVTALAFAAAPAMAQDQVTEDEEIEEIVVTGIRASIMSSVAKKRASSSIVEAISAEDIGKLPDSSIGESLARLPGLATQRFDGRANKISIRGLAPDFTATTLNGREMVSSDNNRSVEYDQFPSELITGATVYKTPDATLTSQAIGGTVDLQTIRPLDHNGRTIVVGLRGELTGGGSRNPDVSNKGYRGNFAYIDQNEDGSVGWALGYSRMVQPISEQYISHWGYPEIGTQGSGDPYLDVNGNDVDPTTLISGGLKPFVKSNRLTRDGFLGVIEFKPSEDWYSRVDTFYSKFKDRQTLRGAEIPLLWGGATPVSGSLTVEDGLVVSGDYTGMRPMLRNDFTDRDVETYAFGWNTEYQASDSLVFTADLSYSKATRNYSASEMYLSNGRGQSGPSYDLGFVMEGENGITIDSDIDLSETGGWKLGDNLGWGGPLCSPDAGWQCATQDLFRNTETSSDDLAAIKLAAEQSFDGALTSVEYGVRYSERNKDHSRLGYWTVLDAYSTSDDSLQDIPAEYRVADTSLDFFGLGNLISFDPRAMWESGLYGDLQLNQFDEHIFASESWKVKEKVFNAYVKANFETDTVTGNVGLQAIHTDQSSVGAAVDIVPGSNPVEITVTPNVDGIKYWTFLPSFNMSYHIDDDNKLRFGLARIMARPNMDAMHASRQFSFNIANAGNTDIDLSPWGGSGGNTQLKPWMAWQFDLAFETYFGQGGYFAVSTFYKQLDSWVYNDNQVLDFTGYPYPTGAGIDPVTFFQGKVWSPQNGEGGKIYGLELSTSVPFDMFSESLEGFGFLGSASFTSSEVREKPEDEPFELPGLSKTVLNGTLYYEKNGFAIRGSVRHRATYISESFAISLTREFKNAYAETIFDAQVSYDLEEIGIEGGTIYLQGSNLTNEPYISYENGDPRLSRNFHTYGRNFMFGFSYKM